MTVPPGGSFLYEQTAPESVFTPEDFSDEQRMIGDLASRFIENEVLPQQESMERQEWQTTVRLLRRCGELGLLGIEIPVEYGGESLDKVSAMIVAEKFARVASFGVSYGGQAGLGALPIAYFGTEELKRRYLPAVCRGDILSAYALSEASSGSDALAAKATATRSADGRHWVLNGEKMWITNAAFADIFVTFAQVDGREFTCFIVEKSFPGVSTGAEERKMGLKGSSTRTLVLNNALVPAENLVGEIGKGHRVALNILNIGRAKLGAMAVGAGRTALHDAMRYAKQRMAFGKPIAAFGAIQHKIAEMAIRIWVVESMVYRTAGALDAFAANADPTDPSQLLEPLRRYAAECSILKVYGSEALDFVVDEAVQIYGGYGFSAEYPVERYYRDARVNRIFEGTNEINRLMIAGTVLKGHRNEQAGTFVGNQSAAFDAEVSVLNGARTVFGRTASFARNRFEEGLKDEQEVLVGLSNIIMEIHAMDSALARARKHQSEWSEWITRTFVNDAVPRIVAAATTVMAASITDGSELTREITEMRRLMEWSPINTVLSRRRLAAHFLEQV
jgi:alkylation response protein AidB-like acyl-CoA dehydrogenase